VKFDFDFDLLTGSIVSHSLQADTEQDKSIGKEFVIEVRRSDLVLGDMGYFRLNAFTEIEQREAWWLTRLPLATGVLLADGHTLETSLKSSCGNILLRGMFCGKLPGIFHNSLCAAVYHRPRRRRTRQALSSRRHARGPGMSRTQKSGHSGAKLSYGGRVRESDRRSLVTVQGRSGW
jgi:Transposase DDE domain